MEKKETAMMGSVLDQCRLKDTKVSDKEFFKYVTGNLVGQYKTRAIDQLETALELYAPVLEEVNIPLELGRAVAYLRAYITVYVGYVSETESISTNDAYSQSTHSGNDLWHARQCMVALSDMSDELYSLGEDVVSNMSLAFTVAISLRDKKELADHFLKVAITALREFESKHGSLSHKAPEYDMVARLTRSSKCYSNYTAKAQKTNKTSTMTSDEFKHALGRASKETTLYIIDLIKHLREHRVTSITKNKFWRLNPLNDTRLTESTMFSEALIDHLKELSESIQAKKE